MAEKDINTIAVALDWARQSMPYLTTFFLSIWGGTVNYITKVRSGQKKFKLKELILDLIVSTFAGLITFHFCRSAGISETMSAVLIAISGHMGTRAIAGFEMLYSRVIGVRDWPNDKN